MTKQNTEWEKVIDNWNFETGCINIKNTATYIIKPHEYVKNFISQLLKERDEKIIKECIKIIEDGQGIDGGRKDIINKLLNKIKE